jgi:hypothetical protein
VTRDKDLLAELARFDAVVVTVSGEGVMKYLSYVGGETQAKTDAATESATSTLPESLKGWLKCSAKVRSSLQSLLAS